LEINQGSSGKQKKATTSNEFKRLIFDVPFVEPF
jgi:hypothetical protein